MLVRESISISEVTALVMDEDVNDIITACQWLREENMLLLSIMACQNEMVFRGRLREFANGLSQRSMLVGTLVGSFREDPQTVVTLLKPVIQDT